MEKNKRKPHFDYYVVSLTLLATKNPEKKNPKNSNQISQSVSWVLDKVQFSVISNPRRRTIYYSKFLSFSHYFHSIQTIVSNVQVDWLNWEKNSTLNREIDQDAALGERDDSMLLRMRNRMLSCSDLGILNRSTQTQNSGEAMIGCFCPNRN